MAKKSSSTPKTQNGIKITRTNSPKPLISKAGVTWKIL